MNQQDLDFDRDHVWHPYTSMTRPLPNYAVKSASGVRLMLDDGRELIDGMASWWCAIHGYNHPVLNEAIQSQLVRMSHVMFGGITHQPAVDLARRLVAMTPAALDKVFFCDSGSVAVEVAIKMAVQYWACMGRPQKCRLATIRGGYHGDTSGAMSVCDPVSGMHGLFRGILMEHFFADTPTSVDDTGWDGSDLVSMEQVLQSHHMEIAAVILEPVVQGAGGMRFYAPRYLRELRALCDAFDVLLIFDEIATGFGRTGRMFALEHADATPDILCLGKAITGGYMSFAATLATRRISDGFATMNDGVFMHGPTFMGNPLACAVAVASIDLLLSSDWRQKVDRIEAVLCEELAAARSFDGVTDVRVMGAIGVIEMKAPVDMAQMQRAFVDRGVWVRPFGRLVYVMPPYVIGEGDLRFLAQQMVAVVRQA